MNEPPENKGIHTAYIILLVITVSLGLWINITRQATSYGNGNGTYADQVDSFSEYIIRNTVINNIIGRENRDGSLILTKGYQDKDYNYYASNTKRYHSHRGIQVEVYEKIAKIKKDIFINNSELYFTSFRLVNCFLLTICFTTFFLCTVGRNIAGIISTILFSFSGGIALFSSNLYFSSWLLFSPLACQYLLTNNFKKTFMLAAFLLSLLYFSVRYEFATTFTFMWFVPVIIQNYLERKKTAYGVLFQVFLTVVAGFITAIVLHHVSVARVVNIPIGDASSLIFASLQLRMASINGVSPPLSPDFFYSMLSRLSWTGFSFPLLGIISKFCLLILFLFAAYRERKSLLFPAFLWALAGYMSWYIFAYQHIMWHDMYDSLLFAATIQLILIFYAAKKSENFFSNSFSTAKL